MKGAKRMKARVKVIKAVTPYAEPYIGLTGVSFGRFGDFYEVRLDDGLLRHFFESELAWL